MNNVLKYSATALAMLMAVPAGAGEVGQMYVRADAGYAVSKFKANNKDKDSKQNIKGDLEGFKGSLGIGYNAAKEVRADVQFDFMPTLSKKNIKVNDNKVEVKVKPMKLMFNAYYDFDSNSSFTPYVTAGIGGVRKHMTVKTTDKDSKTTTEKTKNKTGVAYQAGVGVAFEMAKDIYLDLGYRIGGDTVDKLQVKAKNKTDKKTTFKTKDLNQSLMAGVRFYF